ncbi:MAG: hypothetical protein AAF329_20775 [Cyanobacteria bacterium P01_A01_bin.17]
MGNAFDRLYPTINYETGITPWSIVAESIEQGCLPWSDPRFIQNYYHLLCNTFRHTSRWLKGQYYAQLVLDQMPPDIDDDLRAIAAAVVQGRIPESESWNGGNPYLCTWPATHLDYCYPWNGLMFRWALGHIANKRMLRRLKHKVSGYKSPRRNQYLQG